MTVIRSKAMREPKHPLEVTSKEELYKRIDKGLEDVRQGRVRPFDDVINGIMDDLQARMEQE